MQEGLPPVQPDVTLAETGPCPHSSVSR
jgi:hypothetical protein